VWTVLRGISQYQCCNSLASLNWECGLPEDGKIICRNTDEERKMYVVLCLSRVRVFRLANEQVKQH
jgi:hypothetical protein